MAGQLKYLSDKSLLQLRSTISKNLSLYQGEGFTRFAGDPGWDIRLGVDYDEGLLATLNTAAYRSIAAVDLENSKVVGKALEQLTPSVANEERIWVRLAHVEAFGYCKSRWLHAKGDEDLVQAVTKHFFAATQTGVRDDHALSRLWWNYQIAKTCLPENPDEALSLILKTADIRSNFVERIWMTSRRRIASAVLRAMRSEAWITDAEKNFRQFMKALNKLGGGIVFEVLDDSDTDRFVADCVAYSRNG